MTNALFKSPMHPWKQMRCFADMTKDDYHQTSCAEQLQKRAHRLSSKEQDYRTRKQHARRHQCSQPFKQRGVHGVLLGRRLAEAIPASDGATSTMCFINSSWSSRPASAFRPYSRFLRAGVTAALALQAARQGLRRV